MYVNESANSRLALNLSFNIITIFSLIYNKSRCDQREKKNSNKTADSLQENFLKIQEYSVFTVFTQQDGRKKRSAKRLFVTGKLPFHLKSPQNYWVFRTNGKRSRSW